MKKLSFSITVFFLMLPFAPAFSSDLTIDAESILFDKGNQTVFASGEVRAFYNNISLEAEQITYQSKTHQIESNKKSTIFLGSYSLVSDHINYNLKTKIGTAESSKINIDNIYIFGKKIYISPEQVLLKDACFSSCDLPNQHYKFMAKDLVLYPETGWVVMHWGTLYLGGIPVLPVPTYVYDIGPATGRKTSNPAPFPEIGSDPTDGIYLHDKIVWRLSSYSYGMASIDYGSNKGLGGGFEGNYVLNNNNQGNARLNYWGSDGWFGGITHMLYFGEDIQMESVRHLLYQVLRVPPKKRYELITDVSIRERVNYQRINLTPNFTIRSSDIDLGNGTNYNLETQIGQIHEENSGLDRTRFKIKGSINNASNINGTKSDIGLWVDDTLYNFKDTWLQLKGQAMLSRNIIGTITGKLGYEHYFMYHGGTPFLFENYRLFLSDALTVGTGFSIGASTFSVDFTYNTPDFSPRDFDYIISMGSHCYEILLKYRATRNEFSFGVNLLSGS